MTGPTFETLHVTVAGPIEGHADGKLWRWTVDRQIVGNINVAKGAEDTERDAWMRAANAATAWLAERVRQ